jgi:hypothetical protein
MQNTTFRCGHCGNLMAVGNQFLGQQVACPTCKQVVVAPAPQPVPSPAPVLTPEPEPEPVPFQQQPSPFQTLSLDSEHESIFSTPTSDDLFDEPAPVLGSGLGSGLGSTLEYQADPALEPIQPMPGVEPDPGLNGTPEPAPVLTGDNLANPAADLTPAQPLWSTQTQDQAPAEEPSPLEQPSAPRQRRRDTGGNWLIIFMIPLVSYAVLATALIFYLWNRIEAVRNAVGNPIQLMPDINGDWPGAKKAGAKALSWKATDDLVVAALPGDRKVKLGETLVVGNLEVIPTKVERKKVGVFVRGFEKPEPCEFESLVLHFKFKNLSKEYAFVPLEDSFDRHWTGAKVENVPPLDAMPLTVLQVGSSNYFGGPADWLPRIPPKKLSNRHREWVEGRPGPNEVKQLQPGATQETFTCTDGQKKEIVPAALGYKGEIVWRVHLRQGPVEVKDRDQLIPSTTVVGVYFAAADIAKQ